MAHRRPGPALRLAAPLRAATLALVLVTGGGAVALQLTAAATPPPAAGGPIDAAPDVTLGPRVQR